MRGGLGLWDLAMLRAVLLPRILSCEALKAQKSPETLAPKPPNAKDIVSGVKATWEPE